MGATSTKNVISLSAVRAERRMPSLPISLEVVFDAPRERQPMGRSLWFSVVASALLWAVIAGAVWFF
jgi:hypothetical protein